MPQVGPATLPSRGPAERLWRRGLDPRTLHPTNHMLPVTCRALKATPASRGMREKLGTLERT